MKKIFIATSVLSMLMLASCNGNGIKTTTTSSQTISDTVSTTSTSKTDTKTTTDSIVSTSADDTSTTFTQTTSTSNESTTSTANETTTTTTNPVVISTDLNTDTTTIQDDTTTTEDETTTTTPIVLKEATLYMVGDSTMSSFSDAYYLPRYGYGTQMYNWLDSKITVKNLALSGRSSLSFLSEANYTTLKNSITEGDYLVIGFGHNDEKSDEVDRFRNADYSSIEEALADTDSFQYNIYQNYVKLAIDKGATPILATPIVRANGNDDYTGSEGHVTKTGDYRQAIVDVANYYGIDVIDLTTITKNQYVTLGFNEAKWYHAFTGGTYAEDGTTIVAKESTLDATHLNIYGAKYVSYKFAKSLYDTSCYLKHYVKADIEEPTKANDLVPNSNYVPSTYESFDGSTYNPDAAFKTLTEGLYGTAFGDIGVNSPSSAYVAKETSTGVFSVGTSQKKGKIAAANPTKQTAASFGFAGVFRQVEISKNYTITAKAKVTTADSTMMSSQAGFGLMIRDDLYKPTNDKAILSNCICAGILTASSSTVNFAFENEDLVKSSNTTSTLYTVDTEATFTISRVGQTITATTEYDGKTYTNSYYDFDLVQIDSPYYYIGMWATRGTIVEFSNVEITYTGDSQGA